MSDKVRKKLIDPDAWRSRRDFQDIANRLVREVGTAEYMDYNEFFSLCEAAAKRLNIKISKTDLDKKICRLMAVADPEAKPVVAKRVKPSAKDITTLIDIFGVDIAQLADYGMYLHGKEYIIYESDSDLRDTEKIPVGEE